VIAVAVPEMVSVVVPSAAVAMVRMSLRLHVEEQRVGRIVDPPTVTAVAVVAVTVVVTVAVTVAVAVPSMVVKSMPAHLVEHFVEDCRGQTMQVHLPVVAWLVVPDALVLAFAAKRGLDADGERRQQ